MFWRTALWLSGVVKDLPPLKYPAPDEATSGESPAYARQAMGPFGGTFRTLKRLSV
jgi:hypothetical protein